MRGDEFVASSRLGVTGACTWPAWLGSTEPHLDRVIVTSYVAHGLVAPQSPAVRRPIGADERTIRGNSQTCLFVDSDEKPQAWEASMGMPRGHRAVAPHDERACVRHTARLFHWCRHCSGTFAAASWRRLWLTGWPGQWGRRSPCDSVHVEGRRSGLERRWDLADGLQDLPEVGLQ